MSTPVIFSGNDLSQQLALEVELEAQFQQIALGIEINGLMPDGVNYQAFSRSYKAFSQKEDTPELLIQCEYHALRYIESQGFDDENKRQGAYIYVIGRIWKRKSASGKIFMPGLLQRVRDAETVRAQKVEMHKAVARLANGAAEKSYEQGLAHNWRETLAQANANQLAEFIAPPALSHSAVKHLETNA